MNLKTILQLTILYFTLTSFQFAFADMAESSNEAHSNGVQLSRPSPPRLKIADVTKYYQSIQKKRKLTDQEEQVLNLATTAADVFWVSEVDFENSGKPEETSKEQMVNSRTIILEIQNSIKRMKTWEPVISGTHLDKVKQIASTIKSEIGDKTYAWAWLSYQTGEKNRAKEILTQLFENHFKTTMSLKNIGFQNSDPISESTTLSGVLAPISTPAETKDRESKIQKMKIHVSNLPNYQIMT